MWLKLIVVLLPLLKDLIGEIGNRTDCPDGVCSDVQANIDVVQSAALEPRTEGVFDFLGCVDIGRAFAAGRRLVQLVTACGPITSFPDFLKCVDAEELVKVLGEIVSVLMDALQCNPDQPSSSGPVPE